MIYFVWIGLLAAASLLTYISYMKPVGYNRDGSEKKNFIPPLIASGLWFYVAYGLQKLTIWGWSSTGTYQEKILEIEDYQLSFPAQIVFAGVGFLILLNTILDFLGWLKDNE